MSFPHKRQTNFIGQVINSDSVVTHVDTKLMTRKTHMRISNPLKDEHAHILPRRSLTL